MKIIHPTRELQNNVRRRKKCQKRGRELLFLNSVPDAKVRNGIKRNYLCMDGMGYLGKVGDLLPWCVRDAAILSFTIRMFQHGYRAEVIA